MLKERNKERERERERVRENVKARDIEADRPTYGI